MMTIQPDHILAAMASLTPVRPRGPRPESPPPVAARMEDLRPLLDQLDGPRLVWLRACA